MSFEVIVFSSRQIKLIPMYMNIMNIFKSMEREREMIMYLQVLGSNPDMGHFCLSVCVFSGYEHVLLGKRKLLNLK